MLTPTSLHVLGEGDKQQERANDKGRLFEELTARLFESMSYVITDMRRGGRAAEIDVEGHHKLTHAKFLAECKCWEDNIGVKEYQAFSAKCSLRRKKLQDDALSAVMLALPGITGEARVFHDECVIYEPRDHILLLEKEDVIKHLVDACIGAPPAIDSVLAANPRLAPGDAELVYAAQGLLWLQYFVERGSTFARYYALFHDGDLLVDEDDVYASITRLKPDLAERQPVRSMQQPTHISHVTRTEDQIVDLAGSSSFFEYQFPASSDYFVGRHAIVGDLTAYIHEAQAGRTAARGILVEGNSGVGKSSLILKMVSDLRLGGDAAFAIDCRTLSTAHFFKHVLAHCIDRMREFDWSTPITLPDVVLSGEASVKRALSALNNALMAEGRSLVILLDQFENVLLHSEALRPIRDAMLVVTELQGNVILGFSWKSDLLVIGDEYPYQERDCIRENCRSFRVDRFLESEVEEMIDALRSEIRYRPMKALRYLLAEFSQGLPWLLKKMCSHVIKRHQAGLSQREIVDTGLDLKQVFDADREALTHEEEEVLNELAAERGPVSMSVMGKRYEGTLLQSLVGKRLVVKIGTKYDIYHDTFREYLLTGAPPVAERYILKAPCNAVLRAVKKLADAGGHLSRQELMAAIGVSEQTFYNYMRDMRLLGLAVIDDEVSLGRALRDGSESLTSSAVACVRDALERNLLVRIIRDQIPQEGALRVDRIGDLLAENAPYVAATSETWRAYAGTLVSWLDFAKLVVFDRRSKTISLGSGDVELAEGDDRELDSMYRGGGKASIGMPLIQFSAVVEMAKLLCSAIDTGTAIDWTGMSKSKRKKCVGMLERLGVVRVSGRSIAITHLLTELVYGTAAWAELVCRGMRDSKALTEFREVLRMHADKRLSNRELGTRLAGRLQVEWAPGTAEVNAKILLDWARHGGFCPPVYAQKRGKATASSDG